jgi:hypothetical protein
MMKDGNDLARQPEEYQPSGLIDNVRQHLRELERFVANLPTDTRDQQIASRRIRSMVGDQLAELSWWRT